jgi:hypothetical protein
VKRAVAAAGFLVLASGVAAQSVAQREFESVIVTAQTVQTVPTLFGPACDPVPGWCRDTFDLHVQFTWTSRPPAEVTLQDVRPLLTPDMIQLRGNRLVIASADEAVLFDAGSGAFLDRIAGFRVTHSGDGRYLAYVRVSSSRERWSDDVYLIYDLDRSVIGNRMMDSLPDMPKRSAAATNAGVAVYPRENAANASYYDPQTAAAGAHHLISPIVWLSSTELVFVDRWQNQAEIVLIELVDDAAHAVAREAPLNAVATLRARGEVTSIAMTSRTPDAITIQLDGVTTVRIPLR